MIREKMFVISSILDESIKSQTPIYDVTLFNSFVDFENYIEGTPIIINTLVISTKELPFNNSNMARLMIALTSPFLQIKGPVIYIIGMDFTKKIVDKFFEGSGLDKYVVYQGDIDLRYMTDIITGEARDSQEQQVYEVTYRIRAKDYVRQASLLSYQDSEQKYVTDEDSLQGIPDEEEPIDIRPVTEFDTNITYVAGDNREERTLMCFLLSQYMSLTGKTIIIEHDTEYHRLTEYYTKSGTDNSLFIAIDELYNDIQEVILRIKESREKLIVIGAINRVKYDYQFMFSLLFSNLRTYVSDFVMECDYEEVPYNVDVIYVCQNTVPDVIKMAMSIKQVIDVNRTKFIGLQMHDIVPIDLNADEISAIISAVLSKNGVDGEVVYAGGVKLKGEDSAYDVRRIIRRDT